MFLLFVQCPCDFERSVSFFIAPFYFEAFHTSQPSPIRNLDPFGVIRLNGTQNNGKLEESEVYFGKLSDLHKRESLSQHPGMFDSKVKRKHRGSELSFSKRGSSKDSYRRQSSTATVTSSASIPIRCAPAQPSLAHSRGKYSVSTNSIFPISCDRQYVRSVSNTLWIRSKSCAGEMAGHLTIVLFFGGKDMLALGWLDLLGQWIEAEIKSKVGAPGVAAKRRVVKKEAVARPPKATANPPQHPKTPRHLPKWDSTAFAKRSPGTRRIENSPSTPAPPQDDSDDTGGETPASPSPTQTATTPPSLEENSPSTPAPPQHDSDLFKETPPSPSPTQTTTTPSSRPSRLITRPIPNIKCRVNVAFGLVEFPGYGYGEGLPSPSSCVDGGLEVVRSIIGHTKPATVELHIIGYSLGCAIALRVANMIADQIVDNSNQNFPWVKNYHESNRTTTLSSASHTLTVSPSSSPRPLTHFYEREPLTKVVALKSLLLIAPFSTTWETANSLLRVPASLQRVSKFLFDIVSDKTIQYDNKEAIGRLARIMKSSMW